MTEIGDNNEDSPTKCPRCGFDGPGAEGSGTHVCRGFKPGQVVDAAGRPQPPTPEATEPLECSCARCGKPVDGLYEDGAGDPICPTCDVTTPEAPTECPECVSYFDLEPPTTQGGERYAEYADKVAVCYEGEGRLVARRLARDFRNGYPLTPNAPEGEPTGELETAIQRVGEAVKEQAARTPEPVCQRCEMIEEMAHHHDTDAKGYHPFAPTEPPPTGEP
ncbi:hypothetical protein LCGC14_2918310 [marine sediment metagenome]|uniref:Uncharacterized protein n=1 Tax=marine sediment metagenome TaxID=412755 RepID=A0A0F8XPW1_9ZZZZ